MRISRSSMFLLVALGLLCSQRSLPGQGSPAVESNDQSLLTFPTPPSALPVPGYRLDLSNLTRPEFAYHYNLSLFEGQSTPTPRPRKSQPERVKRPPIDPSMVGYIEDASVRTEVRIRFDAALHDDTPDRAEFFYGKCGCYASQAAMGTSIYDPNAPGPGPGIPQYVNFQQLYFQGEYAVRPRISFFTQIPIRWLQPNSMPGVAPAFPDSGGIGDLQLGLKVAAFATPRSHLTFQLRSALPTGDSHRGLGTNHASIEPAILYQIQLTDRFAVEGEVGDTHPIGGSKGVPISSPSGFAGDVFFYGIGPSYLLVDHENFRLATVVELVGWNVISGLVTGRTSTDGVNIVNLKIGPRIDFGTHSSFYAGYGIALTSQTWYREIFRMEYRYAF